MRRPNHVTMLFSDYHVVEMIQSLPLRITFFGVLLSFVFCLAGCDKDWAKRFEYGRVQPNFRLTVTLPQPSSKSDLFARFEALAYRTGFTEYRGRPITEDMFEPDAKYHGFDFFPGDAGEDKYRIGFHWQPPDVEEPSRFEVIFYNRSMDDFTAQEWLIFRNWKETILPAEFPDATIEVTRHPVVFTDKKKMLEISRTTGIPIPENLKEKYMKYTVDSPR